MHKCQHNKTISKFCLFEHCQSKEPGGCEDCIKKHHNHIGQISFLNEDDIKNIVKKFQIEANYRPKSRSLQQSIFNFFTHVKTNISLNLDLVCKNLINQIGYPYLQKNGTLNCYKRLKNKQYRKVTQKELKELWDLFKTTENNEILKEEKNIYAQAIVRIQDSLDKMQKTIKQTFDNLIAIVITQVKPNLSSYDRSLYLKINDIFKEIKRYPVIPSQKKQQNSSINKETQINQQKSIESKKPTRDISIDRQFKVQNKIKTLIKSKTQEKEKTDNGKFQTLKEEKQTYQQIRLLGKKQSLRQDEYEKIRQTEKDSKTKRLQKYSVELKPQDIVLRNQQKIEKSDFNFNDFSQKEEEILERKKKLMDLMNSKPVNKKQVNEQKEMKKVAITPVRDKQSGQRSNLSDYLKNSLSPDRLNIANLIIRPINIERQQRQRNSTSVFKQQKLSSKRAKTTFDEEQEQSTVGQKKQARNETLMSSQTETQQLFHANVHIPIEDSKQEDEYEINEESVQKCIFVPQVDVLARQIFNMHSECQSPLMIKKKEIQKFSALIKLAESKFIEQQAQQEQRDPNPSFYIDQSSIKLNRILESEIKQTLTPVNLPKEDYKGEKNEQFNLTQLKESKKGIQSFQSAQIDQSEQQSLALLLKSLKLPGPQAIPYLQKSIQYSANNLSSAQYLSYLYLQAQRPQDCLKLCNDILKHISSSETNQLALRLNINKSAALNHLGRYSECITFLQRCLRHRHNDLLYKNLADAYYSIGILEKAIYNYEHAIIQNASNTQAHYNLAVCHYQQQNYYNASIYIEKAFKHQPNNQIYKEMKKHVDQKILANPIV